MPEPRTRIVLAPMHGLVDEVLRDLLTEVGGFDLAVAGFVRVTAARLPRRAYLEACPELGAGGHTPAGTPVAVQLLGADPQLVARSAARLASLSPAGIDLNFGCPAPLVNRRGVGAVLLEEPGRLEAIAAAVRAAVPPDIPVTGKMRLGVSHPRRAIDCARALEAGGVAALCVHARTRDQGYEPPANWELVAGIRAAVGVPVMANGEVWSVADALRCREVTGCADLMLGRGAVADPFLARRIRAHLADPSQTAAEPQEGFADLAPMLGRFWAGVVAKLAPRHAPGRLKLWLGWLSRTFPAARSLLAAIRAVEDAAEVSAILAAHGVPIARAAAR